MNLILRDHILRDIFPIFRVIDEIPYVLMFDTYHILSFNSEKNSICLSPEIGERISAYTPRTNFNQIFDKMFNDVSLKLNVNEFYVQEFIDKHYFVFYKKPNGELIFRQIF